MDTERLTKAQQSGRSEKDLQLLMDQSKRKESEKVEQDERFEGSLVRQRALRLARSEAERLASMEVAAAPRIGGAPPKS